MSNEAKCAAPTMILGLLVFWTGLAIAAQSYPSEYDWRYMTISSLLYQDRNPYGYGWGSAGLVICGLCGLYWVRSGVRRNGWTRATLMAGNGCMALCGLLPSPLFGVAKSHELLAVAAFMAICVGVTRLSFAHLVRSTRAMGHPARLGTLAISCLPLLPVACATAAEIHAVDTDLPWVSIAWRAQGIPAYWSFAFWEWVACGVQTAFLLWLVPGMRHSPR